MMDSLQATDQAAAAVAKAARVTLADIESSIDKAYYTTADRALSDAAIRGAHLESLSILTICIMVMRNGFTVIGKSAPASPENYNQDLGRKFAYEDAVRQIWPLMGFALRERLARS